jgi:hypothetical protein
MKWYSKAEEHEKYAPMTEAQTIKVCERIVGVAIGRWLLSGIDCPDAEAIDGVSEMESAQFME